MRQRYEGFYYKVKQALLNEDAAADEDTRESDEHMRIPMFGRLEIGLGVCIDEYRKKAMKAENKSWSFEDNKNSPGKKKGKKETRKRVNMEKSVERKRLSCIMERLLQPISQGIQ